MALRGSGKRQVAKICVSDGNVTPKEGSVDAANQGTGSELGARWQTHASIRTATQQSPGRKDLEQSTKGAHPSSPVLPPIASGPRRRSTWP